MLAKSPVSLEWNTPSNPGLGEIDLSSAKGKIWTNPFHVELKWKSPTKQIEALVTTLAWNLLKKDENAETEDGIVNAVISWLMVRMSKSALSLIKWITQLNPRIHDVLIREAVELEYSAPHKPI